MYILRQTPEFEKEFVKLDTQIRLRFEKQFKRLIENPYGVGKQLNAPKFRELKQGVFRVYYIINEKEIIVLLVGVSNKTTQQQIIDKIRDRFI